MINETGCFLSPLVFWKRESSSFVLFLFIKPVLVIFFLARNIIGAPCRKCEKYQEKIPERYTVLFIAFLFSAQAAEVVVEK